MVERVSFPRCYSYSSEKNITTLVKIGLFKITVKYGQLNMMGTSTTKWEVHVKRCTRCCYYHTKRKWFKVQSLESNGNTKCSTTHDCNQSEPSMKACCKTDSAKSSLPSFLKKKTLSL